ncbi:hypothetical protein PCANC_20180 [Puccinia coronata f. sp. avenae]|uniref:Uncharacterized protein n=1 Tax=Puccinia coronata f. sp. avenae TaxID=200324 RepID=A0A2N5TW87_9BASI|nr:hypothetical protein PCANC_20180 [Puccinia coronata f. sp. avenae]
MKLGRLGPGPFWLPGLRAAPSGNSPSPCTWKFQDATRDGPAEREVKPSSKNATSEIASRQRGITASMDATRYGSPAPGC